MNKIFINLTGVEVGEEEEVVVADDDEGEGVTFWILRFESFTFDDDELDEEDDDVDETDDDDDDEEEDAVPATLANEAADLLA